MNGVFIQYISMAAYYSRVFGIIHTLDSDCNQKGRQNAYSDRLDLRILDGRRFGQRFIYGYLSHFSGSVQKRRQHFICMVSYLYLNIERSMRLVRHPCTSVQTAPGTAQQAYGFGIPFTFNPFGNQHQYLWIRNRFCIAEILSASRDFLGFEPFILLVKPAKNQNALDNGTYRGNALLLHCDYHGIHRFWSSEVVKY